MRKSFKQVVSGLLAAALLLPGGLIAYRHLIHKLCIRKHSKIAKAR
ncbi:hypothetical protein [Paenibacillus sp. FSL R7-0026]